MVGTKGKSGGPRPGAGRPVESFTLKRHTEYGVRIGMAHGALPINWATVIQLDRKTIVLELDNGDRLMIFR